MVTKTRIEQWSESAFLQVVARVAVTVGTPALLGVLGWVAVSTQSNSTQISVLSERVNASIQSSRDSLANVQHELDGFEKVTKDVQSDHETRIRQLERENDKRGIH